MKIERLKPNEKLMEASLASDPSKTVKIGTDLLEDVKNQLIKCHKKSTNSFMRMSSDMSYIDYGVSFHSMSI